MENSIKNFKLDSTILNDFDKLMEMHLDYVENLTICNIRNDSKIFNIVGLCINVKTLIIEGDQMLNVNSVLQNICKPDKLEKIIFNGTKLPTSQVIKKFSNIKMVSLNNIRFCDVKGFLKDLANPELIEAITLDNVDLAKNSLGDLDIFTNLKVLNILHLENFSFAKIDKILENEKIQRINIEKNEIAIADIKNILKGDCKKQITLNIPSKGKNTKNANTIQMMDGNTSVVINATDVDDFVKKVPLSKIDNLLLIINEKCDINKYLKDLSKIQGKINLAIKDASYLNISDAEACKAELGIDYVSILDLDGILHKDMKTNKYQIDRYIAIREAINDLTNKVAKHATELERVLELYKIISENISIDEFLENTNYSNQNGSKSSNLENGLLEKQCNSDGFAEIFKNCLLCMGIGANILSGTIDGTVQGSWNQVKIDGNWYNCDIALDSQTITNNHTFGKTENYCLISDDEFYRTHSVKVGTPHECKSTVNQKAINTFFKTGIYNANGKGSWWLIIVQKIKSIFSKQKALPEG